MSGAREETGQGEGEEEGRKEEIIFLPFFTERDIAETVPFWANPSFCSVTYWPEWAIYGHFWALWNFPLIGLTATAFDAQDQLVCGEVFEGAADGVSWEAEGCGDFRGFEFRHYAFGVGVGLFVR